jgi:hypothetical protein
MILWVDAVCINQSDSAERTQQVLLMREIYTKANRVYAWLGEEQSSEGSLALDLLGNLSELFGQARGAAAAAVAEQKWSEDPDNLARRCSFLEEFAKQIREIDISGLSVRCDKEAWQAMSQIGRRSWFRRTWTLQEARCGTDRAFVVVGDKVAPLKNFIQTSMLLHELDRDEQHR